MSESERPEKGGPHSYRMSRIGSKDTKIELVLREALSVAGLDHFETYHDIPGCPDIAFVDEKVAVFCDSKFWHGKGKTPKSNREYWKDKFERNVKRDKQVNRELRKMSWKVFRFWEDEILSASDECVRRIRNALEARSPDALSSTIDTESLQRNRTQKG
jgi:DNA mismatch endonuclease (patch repair protein)